MSLMHLLCVGILIKEWNHKFAMSVGCLIWAKNDLGLKIMWDVGHFRKWNGGVLKEMWAWTMNWRQWAFKKNNNNNKTKAKWIIKKKIFKLNKWTTVKTKEQKKNENKTYK